MKNLVTTLCLLIGIVSGFAQGDCGCDYIVPLEAIGFNASSVEPGEVICLEAGPRNGFKLVNANGTSSSPIIIKNCGGDVIIGAGPFSNGFRISQSSNFRLTGTGVDEAAYGIKITNSEIAGLQIAQGSNQYELDHIHISNINEVPAIKLGDNPNCSMTYNEGYYVLKKVRLHHILVNNCETGLLVGHPQFKHGVYHPYCGTIYPHAVKNFSIESCEFYNIYDGPAIACYGTDGRILDNIISNIGSYGIKIGTYSNLDIIQNNINETVLNGIYGKGSSRYEIVNNLLYDNGYGDNSAILIDFDLPFEYSLRKLDIIHNTIVNSGGFNLQIEQAFLINFSSEIRNNIFCEPNLEMESPYEGAPYFHKSISPSVEMTNNVMVESKYDLDFVNPASNDYHLTAASDAVNFGYDTGLGEDFDGEVRNLAGYPDAGAFEYIPERIAYFPHIDLKGLYVNDFKYILGDPVAETNLLEFAKSEGFNALTLYNLAYIHTNEYDLTDPSEAIVLANFIERAKKNYGIVQVGAVGEKDESFDKIEAFNGLYTDNWYQQFDVLNLEFEFWANEASAVFDYYCDAYLTPGGYACTNEGAFEFYMDQLALIDERAHDMELISEIYLGKFNETEGYELSENCDRILLHYYRTSDIYLDGSSIYNYNSDRIQHIGLSDRKPAVMPIFSNREYHMGPWLLSNDMDQAMDTWLHGVDAYDDDFSPGVHDLDIAGHQWYRYTDFPGVDDLTFEVETEIVGATDSEVKIEVYQDVINNQLIVTDSKRNTTNPKQFMLYAANGQLIAEGTLFDQQNAINLDYAPGLYVCKILENGLVISTNKVVVN